MKIIPPKLFYTSTAFLVTTLLLGYETKAVFAATIPTRDFNFGEPLVYGLILIQVYYSLYGNRHLA